MRDFVHLHLHTQYSVLDGAIKIPQCIETVRALGQQAVAITDHGNMHGVLEFFSAAKNGGIKPLIGCEVYITTGSRSDRTARLQGGPRTHHLTLLAADRQGYQNLCRLVSLGYTEGFYFKPRIDWEVLRELNEGLICLSGCVSGEFSSYAQAGNLKGGTALAERYAQLFRERYFLEMQPHTFAEQQRLNAFAREVAKSVGLPLVATNDCHYIEEGDHHAQEVLMCISTGKLITDPDRIRHEGAKLYLKSAEEMYEAFPDDEEALRNTVEIAARCELDFDFSTYHMPKFDPPPGESVEDHFRREAFEGLERRFGQLQRSGRLSPNDRERYGKLLGEEIETIIRMGFAGYFLVVSDFIRWAKGEKIPVGPGRGSAAGSLVAYAMEITEVDPIEHNLLFERFLNPERISLPDIDVDFCIFGRERVIDYVCTKYGRDKVAQILTFGTLKAKAAIKDVGRVLGLSYAETDRIAKLIPAPRQGFDYPLTEAIAMEKRLQEYAQGDGREVVGLALKLEGLTRHTSTHAAGVVIADRPIVDYMPLLVDKDNQIVTQFSMGWVEKIGLVKFDFLGLKTLTVLNKAVEMITADGLGTIDLNALPLDDAKTYRLVSSGRTIGIFQLESGGITEMVNRLRPNCFEDLVAILALYRPGPLDAGMVDHYINRKHGREPVRVLHPILEPILRDTYGIILYQEQIMQIARDMAGYSLGDADLLRRAMGKKKPEEMAKQKEIFLRGAVVRGVPETTASEVFGQMETFARYGFNRSHSVAYALVSYQTAYLKAHFPLYFMAALMSFEMDDTDRTLKNINECREMGVELLPPDVNVGEVGFSVRENRILFGLAALKGVGERTVERVIEERSRSGTFRGLLDFLARLDGTLLNRRTMESFVKSGAFDWAKLSRAEMAERLDELMRLAQQFHQSRMTNQLSLFGGDERPQEESYRPNRPPLGEWPVNVKLAHEKEALGFYLSGHPLEKFRHDLQRLGTATIESVRKLSDGSTVTVGGVITRLKLKNTKKGDRYATFSLEDLRDTVEVIVWPDTYQRVHATLTSEDPVVISGRLDHGDERYVVVVADVQSAIVLRDRTAKEAVIQLSAAKCTPASLTRLRSLFADHHGGCRVKLVVHREAHSETVITLEERIEPSESLCTRVEELFGEPVLSFR